MIKFPILQIAAVTSMCSLNGMYKLYTCEPQVLSLMKCKMYGVMSHVHAKYDVLYMSGLLGLIHVFVLCCCFGCREPVSSDRTTPLNKTEPSSYSVPWLLIFTKAPFWYLCSMQLVV